MHLRVQPRFWLILISLMLIAFSASFVCACHSLNTGRRALAEVTAHRDALMEEVSDLQSALAFAQTDEYVVRVARDELGMIMPGEIRYVSSN